jgi:hypothetical protein
MGKKAKADPTRAERLAALKREFNIPAGKVKNPLTPAQQTASLKRIAEGVAAMDEELADLDRAIIIEGVRRGVILPSWAEKLLKPATEPNAKPKSKTKSKPKSKSAEQKRKSYWDDDVDRVLRENYPDNSAKNFAPKDVVDKVLAALAPKIKESGEKPPSRGLILRKSGHWKT